MRSVGLQNWTLIPLGRFVNRLALGLVLIAGSVAALLLSQEAVAETQQTAAPLSNPTTSITQAGQATKITPEQEAALVEVRKILKEA